MSSTLTIKAVKEPFDLKTQSIEDLGITLLEYYTTPTRQLTGEGVLQCTCFWGDDGYDQLEDGPEKDNFYFKELSDETIRDIIDFYSDEIEATEELKKKNKKEAERLQVQIDKLLLAPKVDKEMYEDLSEELSFCSDESYLDEEIEELKGRKEDFKTLLYIKNLNTYDYSESNKSKVTLYYCCD